MRVAITINDISTIKEACLLQRSISHSTTSLDYTVTYKYGCYWYDAP